jgi:hypothetical protein
MPDGTQAQVQVSANTPGQTGGGGVLSTATAGTSETLEGNLFSALVPEADGSMWWMGPTNLPASTSSYVAIVDEAGSVLQAGGSEFGPLLNLRGLPAALAQSPPGSVPIGLTEVFVNGRWFRYALVPEGTSPTVVANLGVDEVVTPSGWQAFLENTLIPWIQAALEGG